MSSVKLIKSEIIEAVVIVKIPVVLGSSERIPMAVKHVVHLEGKVDYDTHKGKHTHEASEQGLK